MNAPADLHPRMLVCTQQATGSTPAASTMPWIPNCRNRVRLAIRESLQTLGIQHVRGQSQLPDEGRADGAGREVEKIKQGFLRKSDIGAAAFADFHLTVASEEDGAQVAIEEVTQCSFKSSRPTGRHRCHGRNGFRNGSIVGKGRLQAHIGGLADPRSDGEHVRRRSRERRCQGIEAPPELDHSPRSDPPAELSAHLRGRVRPGEERGGIEQRAPPRSVPADLAISWRQVAIDGNLLQQVIWSS